MTVLGRSLGQIAYEAYGDRRKWKVVGGAPMPMWNDQSEELRDAWQAAAEAVARHARAQLGVHEDGVFFEPHSWCAYLNGKLIAAGPDEPIVRAAYQFHAGADEQHGEPEGDHAG